ncbi:MAG: DEAD/DEAH box helicase [Candidatus Odinarchaeia archaeon]
MTLNELEVAGVDERLIELLKSRGVEKLTEIQKLAIKKGVFRKKDVFIASPANSGKSLLANITSLATCLKEPKAKVLILLPLRSQANDLYENLKKNYIKLGLNFTRLNSDPVELQSANIITGTFREADEILLKPQPWFVDVSLIVIEECDLIGEHTRGGLLELLLIILKAVFKHSQFLFLSANIANAFELSEWLNSELVEVYTPNVPIRYSVLLEDEKHSTLFEIIRDITKKNGQTLVFSKNRDTAISLCENVKNKFGVLSDADDEGEIEKIINQSQVDTLKTYSSRKLKNLLKYGIAFHFAGQPTKERLIVEKLFNEKILKIVVSIPEIGSGKNMPARAVVFDETNQISRYTSYDKKEIKYISPNIVHHIFGRAGNPKFDSEAYGIILVKEKDKIKNIEKIFFRKNIKGKLFPRYTEVKSQIFNSDYFDYILCYIIGFKGKIAVRELRDYFKQTLGFYQLIDENKKESVKNAVTLKTIREIIKERSDTTTRLNVEKIPDEYVEEIDIQKQLIKGIIRSRSPSKKHVIRIGYKNGISCDCEHWRFRARKKGIFCKHIIKLIEYILKKHPTEDSEQILLINLNQENNIVKLLLDKFIDIRGDLITLTEKGKISVLTAIKPKLLGEIINDLKNDGIQHEEKFLQVIIKIIENSLIELPFPPDICIDSLKYLVGIIKEKPQEMLVGDFERVLQSLSWMFKAIIEVIEYLHEENLKNMFQKFVKNLHNKISEIPF